MGRSATVYGDARTAPASSCERSTTTGIESGCKYPAAAPRRAGMFTKDRFDHRPRRRHRHLPDGVTAADPPRRHGDGTAYFGERLRRLPAAGQCTTAAAGAPSASAAHEAAPRRARAAQATRPGGRLPGDPTQGRTQARPPDAPPPRRTASPGARTRPRSTPTSPSSPPRSTSPASPPSNGNPNLAQRAERPGERPESG